MSRRGRVRLSSGRGRRSSRHSATSFCSSSPSSSSATARPASCTSSIACTPFIATAVRTSHRWRRRSIRFRLPLLSPRTARAAPPGAIAGRSGAIAPLSTFRASTRSYATRPADGIAQPLLSASVWHQWSSRNGIARSHRLARLLAVMPWHRLDGGSYCRIHVCVWCVSVWKQAPKAVEVEVVRAR